MSQVEQKRMVRYFITLLRRVCNLQLLNFWHFPFNILVWVLIAVTETMEDETEDKGWGEDACT